MIIIKKIDFNEVINVLKELGFNLMGEYVNATTKITIVDNIGYKYFLTFKQIKKSKKFEKFSKTNPYTIYNIKKYIEINCKDTLEYISGEYVDCNSKLLWKCLVCGEYFKDTIIGIIFNKSSYKMCKKCACNMTSEKLKNKENLNIFRDNGYKIISKYRGSNKKVEIEDTNGYRYSISYSSFKVKNDFKKLSKFSVNNSYSIYNINKYLKDNDAKCEVVSEVFNGVNKNIDIKCNCGNIYTRVFCNFLNKKLYICDDCVNKNRRTLEKNCIEKVKKLECNGYKILRIIDNVYVNIMDANGYIYTINITQYTKNRLKNFSIFHLYNKENFNHNLKIYIKANNIKCNFVGCNNYTGASEYNLKFKCVECGKEYYNSFTEFINRRRCTCLGCSKKQSNLSRCVENLLKDSGVKYEKEITFEQCKDKLCLPFDFGIFESSTLKFIIEVDGQQHFEPIKFAGCKSDEDALKAFEYTKFHDKIKNNFCNDNNIELIRIPYFDILNNNLDYLIDKIKNVQKNIC